MLQRKFGFTLEVDIHGMRVADAREQLERLIARCGPDIHEIVVIHGYHGGRALQDMVRNELHVGCKNGIAPALARIMEARYPELRGAFNKHRSQSDGFSE